MAIGGGGSGGVKAYESRVRKATPSFSRSSDGPQGGKGRYASRGALSNAMQAAQYARDNNVGQYFSSSDDNRKYSPTSFNALLQKQKELETKYERSPSMQDYKTYLDKLGIYDAIQSEGIGLGKDDKKFYDTEGRQILSMSLPTLTAQPTFAQFGGDMMRGLFSGYNTYIPQSQSTIGPYGLPVGPEGSVPLTSGGYVQRRQGFIPKYLGSGGALGLIAGALKSIKEKL